MEVKKVKFINPNEYGSLLYGEEENEDSDEASQQNEKIDDENSAGSFAEDLTEENS